TAQNGEFIANSAWMRIIAAKKIDDQNFAQMVIAEIAKNEVIQSYRMEALRELTDQKLLADIAKNSKYSDVREEASRKLADQGAVADYSNKRVDFEYENNAELDGIEITKYTGSKKKVLIPEIIADKPVKSIRYCAFENCTGLTSVMIPDSVTKIGEAAFARCTTLSNVNISGRVTSINDFSFSSCKNLTDITIPSSVTGIGEQVFGDCIALTTITIPDSITRISDTAFYNCIRLTNVSYKGNTYSYNKEKYGLPQEFYNAINSPEIFGAQD
ncbi:MAG: leucine-rich repeat domain-containing protein, partial [Tannerella sp.]|nr:leucine-rich repeat domain-containing protein [Tannerella sp.]